MVKLIINDKWLTGITIIGLLLYMGFMGYVIYNDKPLDYYMFVISAHALANGENIYALPASTYERIASQLGIVTKTTPYGNFTFTAMLIYPLSLLPLRLGAAIWVGLSGLAALFSGIILCSFTTEKWKQHVILSSIVAFVPVLTTLNAGQVNLFVLLTTVLSLYFLHHDKYISGGVILSMSIWLKPLAIALVPLLIWHRKWKAIAALLFGSLLINLFSLAVFGLSATISQFARVQSMVTPSGLYIPLTVQNLNGLIGRATTGISAQMGTILYFAAAGLIGVITVAAIVFKTNEQHFEIEAALLIAATHLIVPLTWYHHLTMLIIVMAFVVIFWNAFKLDVIAILLLLGFILTDIHGFLWKPLSNLPPILSSFPVFMTLFLWGMLLHRTRHSQFSEA